LKHVHICDRAYVTADAFGKSHVVRLGQEMGPENIRTDEPTERVDKKILETLVQPDMATDCLLGLRVDAFVLIHRSTESAK